MPTWSELKRFCENDGWELFKKTDHYYFKKRIENNQLLRTKVSFGSKEISPQLWQLILKKQLQVSQSYFNSKI